MAITHILQSTCFVQALYHTAHTSYTFCFEGVFCVCGCGCVSVCVFMFFFMALFGSVVSSVQRQRGALPSSCPHSRWTRTWSPSAAPACGSPPPRCCGPTASSPLSVVSFSLTFEDGSCLKSALLPSGFAAPQEECSKNPRVSFVCFFLFSLWQQVSPSVKVKPQSGQRLPPAMFVVFMLL